MGRLAQKLVFWTWPEGHVWPGEGPGVWAPMTQMVLLSLQLEAFVDMAFCAWILGTSPWEVVTQKALLRDPTMSLSPLRHCSPGTHSLLLPS